MASTYPQAVYKPLGAQSEPTMRAHDIVCLHTMVGYLSSTDRYFRAANGRGYDGTESHYGVGGPWGSDGAANLDGTVWQWQDRGHQADANVDGNPRVISVETADNAPRFASDIKGWSPAQIDAIVDLLIWETSVEAHAKCPSSWECHKSGIPRQLIPDTKPGRRGIGYHRQGVPGYVSAGGEEWSISTGKVCPGGERIAQLRNVILPRVQAADAAKRKPNPDAPADKPTPKPGGSTRTPRALGVSSRGDKGPVVVLWQRAAGATPDGIFGPGTEADVKALQRHLGVGADGAAGLATLKAYLADAGTLSRGDNGTPVRFVQAIAGLGTDGDFGPLTDTAVREMQRWGGLAADGVVGPATRAKIVR